MIASRVKHPTSLGSGAIDGALIAIAIALCSPIFETRAMDLVSPCLFVLTIETNMPNLEENLRYTTAHEKRYLAHRDFPTAFPALNHPALSDCRLSDDGRQDDVQDAPQDDVISYRLVCTGGHGTTGSAQWIVGKDKLWGRLNVKLGGKNMNYSQTVTATAIGSCPLEK
jgi:hypothetical protein